MHDLQSSIAAWRLPSLDALRAFEAAGRHLSFTLAAAEFGVTQGAVSRRIRGLEQVLGARLFERRIRAVALTPAGRRYLAAVQDGLAVIARGTAAIRSEQRPDRLVISALPSFAARWLMPRLAADPPKGLVIELDPSHDLIQFPSPRAEAALRYGPGGWPDCRAERLMGEQIVPVATPAYIAQNRLKRPRDLTRGVLLHATRRDSWAFWLETAGIGGARGREERQLGDYNVVIQAALAGQGVALGRLALIGPELADGRLVAVCKPQIPDESSYWLVAAQGAADTPRLRRFRDWLHRQIA